MLKIDPTANISALADIEDSTRGTLIEIGARTMIDAFVKIKPAGGMGDVVIGADCAINSGTVIYTGNGVRIGDVHAALELFEAGTIGRIEGDDFAVENEIAGHLTQRRHKLRKFRDAIERSRIHLDLVAAFQGCFRPEAAKTA